MNDNECRNKNTTCENYTAVVLEHDFWFPVCLVKRGLIGLSIFHHAPGCIICLIRGMIKGSIYGMLNVIEGELFLKIRNLSECRAPQWRCFSA